MLKIEKLADELEAIVDRSSIAEVVEALALVCSVKADHIRENWQNEPLAKTWELFAGALVHTESKLKKIA